MLGSRSSSSSDSSMSSPGGSPGSTPSPPRFTPLDKIESQAAAEVGTETSAESETELEVEALAEAGAGTLSPGKVGVGGEMQASVGTGAGVQSGDCPSVTIDMSTLLAAEDHQSHSRGGLGRQKGERLGLRLVRGGPLEGMGEEEVTNILLFGSTLPTPTPTPTAEDGSGEAQGVSGGKGAQCPCPKAAQRSLNARPHSLSVNCQGASRGRQGEEKRGIPTACDWASSDDVLCALVWKVSARGTPQGFLTLPCHPTNYPPPWSTHSTNLTPWPWCETTAVI